jgi:hypothetical protein
MSVTEYPAGTERGVLPRRKKGVRHGSSELVIFAGLSVAQFVTVMFIKPGKKK